VRWRQRCSREVFTCVVREVGPARFVVRAGLVAARASGQKSLLACPSAWPPANQSARTVGYLPAIRHGRERVNNGEVKG
jgi:hypothetical protein